LNTRIKELRGAGLVEHGEFGYHLSRQGSSLLEVLGPLQAWSKGWETALERARGSAESRGSRSG
jgi:DNA-binding HxlR family transcriptional regulator